MADRWIVTSYVFAQHRSLEEAQKEHARLTEQHGKTFRVHRIKTTLKQSNATEVIAGLRAEVSTLRALIATACGCLKGGYDGPYIANHMQTHLPPPAEGDSKTTVYKGGSDEPAR